ncbi:Fic family protein, partial [Paenibacillus enshidis]
FSVCVSDNTSIRFTVLYNIRQKLTRQVFCNSQVLKSIDDEHAGAYRNENVIISGATHIPSDFVQVKALTEELIQHYDLHWQTNVHAVERGSLLHIEFVKIHPFIDGNGRTARLLLNFELMKNGYPPIVIEKEDRAEYYRALDLAHTTGDHSQFIGLVTRTLNRTFDLYLRLI